ncbi:MAG: citryl-CoA lyase [Chloroflexi bacterium]|nr:MAG: citryl-CoA lyase [Chloroflexota bacterium]TMF20938.1 MAG: citryl-CoA lyase [Chloroflexota bacterium]TMF97337.1 MAG: citryl-CoA lyase [Chloroflexota bacterium]
MKGEGRGRRRPSSRLGRSTADQVFVRGHDLADLIGKVNLGDFAFFELLGRLPEPRESVMFNALAVTLVEHGLTPSTIAARLTYFGAPEALQAAVAAGVLGMGDRFGGSIEQAARILQEAPSDGDPRENAREIVQGFKARKETVPGLGHPVHRPADPRTTRLFALAAENKFAGRHVKLMELIADEAGRAYGRDLPVNATGAIAAIASEMGLPWRITRGLAVMARAIGLVAHLQEEMEDPMAAGIWSRAEAEGSSETASERD